MIIDFYRKEHKVQVHTTSVLNESGGTLNKQNLVERLPTDWVMFEEMTRVGRLCHIRTATVVSPITVAVFAGPSKIPFDALSDSHCKFSFLFSLIRKFCPFSC